MLTPTQAIEYLNTLYLTGADISEGITDYKELAINNASLDMAIELVREKGKGSIDAQTQNNIDISVGQHIAQQLGLSTNKLGHLKLRKGFGRMTIAQLGKQVQQLVATEKQRLTE